jgi:hypothetical protein
MMSRRIKPNRCKRPYQRSYLVKPITDKCRKTAGTIVIIHQTLPRQFSRNIGRRGQFIFWHPFTGKLPRCTSTRPSNISTTNQTPSCFCCYSASFFFMV